MVKAEIESVVKKYINILNDTGLNIQHAYIYGSCARGENSIDSDIDVMLVSEDYWNVITSIKHPVMKDKEDEVRLALSDPDEIRQSIKDENVYLFYRIQKQKRWICAVIKDNTGKGFLITAYPTDNIKEGKVIWKK